NGFLSAMSTASQFIGTGAAQRAVVLGTETMSRILDWSDRTTRVLFGDGAGAVVLEAAQPGEPGRIEAPLLRSDGSQASLLYATGPCTPGNTGIEAEARLIMDGRAFFRSAVKAMADSGSDAIAGAGLTGEDIALCVPHQANERILVATARQLGVPMER